MPEVELLITMQNKRRRVIYFILYLLVIPVGLATRKFPSYFPGFVADFGGDVLWSTMFFFLFRAFQPKASLLRIAVYTFAFSLSIELSQLYHAQWIDSLRTSFLGRMLLGSTFLWSDIGCYLTGTIIGWLIALFADKYAAL
jgi:glycopeptide antibiotics resistance protein